jgi:hypothetical protein
MSDDTVGAVTQARAGSGFRHSPGSQVANIGELASAVSVTVCHRATLPVVVLRHRRGRARRGFADAERDKSRVPLVSMTCLAPGIRHVPHIDPPSRVATADQSDLVRLGVIDALIVACRGSLGSRSVALRM